MENSRQSANELITLFLLSKDGWAAIKYEMVRRVYSPYGISPTIRTMQGGGVQPKVVVRDNFQKYRVRKLTPKECYRLMGFTDLDFFKAKTASAEDAEKLVKLDELTATIEAEKLYKQRKNLGCSNSQLYKQAGNSVVVDCLLNGIFKPLKETNPDLFEDLKVGSFFSGIGAFEKALTRLLDD